MEWLTIIPPIVGAFTNLAAFALQALAERLLTLALAGLLITGVGVFAVAAFSWLWLKRVVGDLHVLPRIAHH